MKKISAFLLMLVMVLALFTGCSDPLYDDFANYLNVEMTEVNENYEKIKEEIAGWENIEEDSALAESLSSVLLPIVEESLEKLKGIKPETEEVKAIKAKYVKVMKAYKKGFEELLKGIETGDETTLENGNISLTEGIEMLEEYNADLEALAEKVGAEIEY